MKHLRPRFSIVIPCYNEAHFVAKTLKSLQEQNFSGDYEIIVVDNNSTDETVSIAESYGVKVIAENHQGVCWARQAGTKAAKGKIVISADADTVYPKDWLEIVDRSFIANRDCVAVTGPCIYRDGPRWGKYYPKLLFGVVHMIYRLTGRPLYITATNTAFKKSAWSRYHTSLTQGGDELALLHDLRSKGKIIFNYRNPVYTSGRRLNKGLAYNFFVSFIIYYLLAYYANKFLRRTVIGTAPTFRALVPTKSRRVLLYKITLILIAGTLIHIPGHDTLLQQSYETFAEIKETFLDNKPKAHLALEHLRQQHNRTISN